MRLFSYVVARDYGFAPNPFYGYCTLATCKPEIRKHAKIGDLVIGTGSKQNDRVGYLVYVMKITECMSFNGYWNDPRFQYKKPIFKQSRMRAYGDNIYVCEDGGWKQRDSHHSLPDGTPNEVNIENDTKVDRVLISDRDRDRNRDNFVYFGGEGPKIEARFRNFKSSEYLFDDLKREDICQKYQGHKCKFSKEFVEEFSRWFENLCDRGDQGKPWNLEEI